MLQGLHRVQALAAAIAASLTSSDAAAQRHITHQVTLLHVSAHGPVCAASQVPGCSGS